MSRLEVITHSGSDSLCLAAMLGTTVEAARAIITDEPSYAKAVLASNTEQRSAFQIVTAVIQAPIAQHSLYHLCRIMDIRDHSPRELPKVAPDIPEGFYQRGTSRYIRTSTAWESAAASDASAEVTSSVEILNEGVSIGTASSFKGSFAVRQAFISLNLWEAYHGYRRAKRLGERIADQTLAYAKDIYEIFEEIAPLTFEALREPRNYDV